MFREDVYYKVYYLIDKGYFTVVTMQWFDENDYNQELFEKDEFGSPLEFDSEVEAEEWMNKHIKVEYIDPALRNKRLPRKQDYRLE